MSDQPEQSFLFQIAHALMVMSPRAWSIFHQMVDQHIDSFAAVNDVVVVKSIELARPHLVLLVMLMIL